MSVSEIITDGSRRRHWSTPEKLSDLAPVSPGQLSPLTSRRPKILDRVPHIPRAVQAWTPHLRRSCQQRCDDRPFRIGAVACVAQPSSAMLAKSGFGPAHIIPVVFATLGES